MKIIGLTGSIGMGKSVTASLLKILKVSVHDSDAAVHEALSPGGGAFADVTAAFPSAHDKKNNRIDRTALGKIVFSDDAKRKMLEKIVHPHVWASQRKFITHAKAMGAKIAVLDIPLLYETGAERRCDKVIVVTAPYVLQKQRVLKRPGMTEERFESILKNQVPDAEKRKRADIVIDTGLGRAETLKALKKALKILA